MSEGNIKSIGKNIITSSPYTIYQAGILASIVTGDPKYVVFSLFAMIMGDGFNALEKKIAKKIMGEDSSIGKRPSGCGIGNGKEDDCTGCGIYKPLNEFNKDKSKPTGYAGYCKPCHQARVSKFHNSWGSGIYQVLNKITNVFYVGKSSQLRRRKCEHFTLNKPDNVASPLLRDSIKQYGKQNFEFIILKKCSVDKLDKLEKQYIQELKPTLNNNDKF